MTKMSWGMMLTIVACLGVLALAPTPQAYADQYDRYEEPADRPYRHERRTVTTVRDEDPYVFSTTRMVNDWDVPAAIKVPLLPAAFVVDIVFLPAEVIADAVR